VFLERCPDLAGFAVVAERQALDLFLLEATPKKVLPRSYGLVAGEGRSGVIPEDLEEIAMSAGLVGLTLFLWGPGSLGERYASALGKFPDDMRELSALGGGTAVEIAGPGDEVSPVDLEAERVAGDDPSLSSPELGLGEVAIGSVPVSVGLSLPAKFGEGNV
jgi:hypothetical protein